MADAGRINRQNEQLNLTGEAVSVVFSKFLEITDQTKNLRYPMLPPGER
jgi:hypothetical protein